MKSAAYAIVILLLLLVTATRAADGKAKKRLPVPDATAREQALATVRDLFKTDIDKAKTVEDQAALVEKLAKTAVETKDDPVGRFVLWQFVVETASKQGDIKAAFSALDEIARDYEVDELSAKSRTFGALAPKITIKGFPEVLPLASGLIGRAVGADRYDIAKAFSEPLNTVAQKFGDAATKKDVAAQRAEVNRLEKTYADMAVALKTLEANATDPTANLTVGKYQLEKGNWEAALSYLALSDDPQFKDIAAKELAQPADVGERIAIADEWWRLGDADKSPLKSRLQAHAADLYTTALPDATGLAKVKVEARLAEEAKIPKSPWDAHFTPGAKHPGEKDPKNFTNTIGLKLNLIPAGEFLMGASDAESKIIERQGEQQHKVKITKPFYMGVYPVTRGQFAQFAAAEKYLTQAEKDGRGAYGVDARGNQEQRVEYNWRNPGLNGNQQMDDHPVVSVSWNDATAFCDWLSKKENKKYRLPTEAEWEYACRAGTKTLYNFGDWLNGTQANCKGTSPFPQRSTPKGPYLGCTTKVGSYKPNAWGLFDMHGNAGQWCADWWDTKYYLNSPKDDPTGPANGQARIYRGGGYTYGAAECRSASRRECSPGDSYHLIGFRVVLETTDAAGGGAKPPAKADAGGKLQFSKWVYPADETGKPGYFVKDANGWAEYKAGNLFRRLTESDRTADYVELHADDRNLWVRITPTQVSWSFDKNRWTVSAKGSPAENK